MFNLIDNLVSLIVIKVVNIATAVEEKTLSNIYPQQKQVSGSPLKSFPLIDVYLEQMEIRAKQIMIKSKRSSNLLRMKLLYTFKENCSHFSKSRTVCNCLNFTYTTYQIAIEIRQSNTIVKQRPKCNIFFYQKGDFTSLPFLNPPS